MFCQLVVWAVALTDVSPEFLCFFMYDSNCLSETECKYYKINNYISIQTNVYFQLTTAVKNYVIQPIHNYLLCSTVVMVFIVVVVAGIVILVAAFAQARQSFSKTSECYFLKESIDVWMYIHTTYIRTKISRTYKQFVYWQKDKFFFRMQVNYNCNYHYYHTLFCCLYLLCDFPNGNLKV